MKRKVIPTIFAQDKKEFNKRFHKIAKITKQLHIDVMDGKFVKAKSIKIKNIPDVKPLRKKVEVHLMMQRPERYLNELRKKGFKKVIFHYEAVKDSDKIKKLIFEIKKRKMEVWIALNPLTPLEKIEGILQRLDGVLFMGVYPGKEGQKFIDKVYGNIKKLRKKDKKIPIQVDGGVNLLNVKKLRKLKVNYVNSGNFVYLADNPKKALDALERVFIN